MRDEKIPCPAEATFGNDQNLVLPSQNLIALTVAIGRPTVDGTNVREKFKEYFNGVGAVDWQQNMIE